ncbi:MAG: AAA family ATPase [Fusobacterium sp.]|uniref:AAA family ATPase n=1 Tax=Fusobacterium sp. TaxID=68766 RepID=UPI00399BB79E
MKKLLPDGISDFKTLIENNYYYVDKTPFISEIGKNVGKTLLFTRPRRFGKTLNMSTLKYFFDIRNAEENKKLFKGLEIEKNSYFEMQGKHPVIFISMKDVKEISMNECKEKLKDMIANLFREYFDIVDSLDVFDKEDFISICKKDFNKIVLENSLKFLAKALNKHYDKKVVILIDEYDTPLVSAYKYGYYNDAKNFFSGLYGSVLKDNTSLQVGVVTGIIRIVRAGIFSDLNNLSEHSILDEEYDEYFGFLEEEVKNILKYYEIDYKLEEIHSWYNGYVFGITKVYNPWSILKYLHKKELKSYWIDTSDNYLIKDILKSADRKTFEKLNRLLFGEKIEEEITGKSTLQEVLEAHDLWELLLFSGYLTIDKKLEDDTYSIKIPNNEVKKFFKDSFIQISFGTNLTFKNLIRNLLDNEIEEFEQDLQEILLKYMSFYDVANIEKVYHSFILGLMIHLEGKYEINSNGEGGLGRYDIVIEPLNKNLRGFILEFKVADSEEKLGEQASEGLKQIKDKKYYIELEKRGIKEMTFLGIAFYKKLLKIKSLEY